MAIWQILLISIGLSLDVFAYCLYKGAMVSELNKKELLKMTLLFTAFQTGMVLIGNALTWIPVIHDHIATAGKVWHRNAAIIFFALGIYMIIKSFRKKYRVIMERKEDVYHYQVIIFWALVTSVDAMIAGVAFGFIGLGIILVAAAVALSTATAGILGIVCGYRLGCGPMNKCVTVGGCMVLIGGLDYLVNYLAAMA